MSVTLSATSIVEQLAAYRYRIAGETSVQDGIEIVLKEHGIPYQREAVVERDRFDFLCYGAIVIEVKIKGSFSEALRQVERYCHQPFVEAIIIATTRRWRRPTAFPLHGKPVHLCELSGRGV
jgi:hypothetical protein